MTEKTTDLGSSSLFVVIIPLALVTVLLVKTWKIIATVIALGIGWQIWQQYEWKQTIQQIDPYFQGLLQEQRGNLTVADLVQKTQIPEAIASRYLLGKARHYGAELLSFGDDRDTYYFLTAGVIQGILADSEPEAAPTKFVPPVISPETIATSSAVTNQTQLPSVPSHQERTTPVISEIGNSTQTPVSVVDPAETKEERQSIDYFPDSHT